MKLTKMSKKIVMMLLSLVLILGLFLPVYASDDIQEQPNPCSTLSIENQVFNIPENGQLHIPLSFEDEDNRIQPRTEILVGNAGYIIVNTDSSGVVNWSVYLTGVPSKVNLCTSLSCSTCNFPISGLEYTNKLGGKITYKSMHKGHMLNFYIGGSVTINGKKATPVKNTVMFLGK